MKIPCLILFVVSITMQAVAQKEDSLRTVIRHTIADSTKALLLSQLADEVAKSNPLEAFTHARAGITLARKTNFEKGLFENYASLASLHQARVAFDSAIIYHHRARRIAEKRHDKARQASVCSGLGHSFMRKSSLDSARFYLDKGLLLSKQTADHTIVAGVYNNYGNVFLEENNYQKALEYFIRSAKVYDSIHVTDQGKCLALSNIGNVEYRLGNLARALDYAKQSMTLALQKGYTSSVAYAHKLTGRIYKKQSKFAEALAEYKEAQRAYGILGDRRSEAELLQNIGNVYFEQMDRQGALRSYLQSLGISKSIGNKPLVANAYSAIGQAEMELKHYPLALHYLDSSRVAARQINNNYLVMDSYWAASAVYEATGDFKRALSMHQRFAELKDSITILENRELAEETQAKYELGKKEAHIALLEKDKVVNDLSLKRSRAIQVGVAIALVLALIIALLLVNRYRLTYRVKRAVEIAEVRNAIARDLHDDIGSALSTINIISKLAMNESPQASNAHFASIAEQSSRMMENMTDMVWSINPVNDSMDKVLVKMKEFAGEILEPKNIRYNFSGEEYLAGLVLDTGKRKNLFLIFKESVNNAAKYSDAENIEIIFSKPDHNLLQMQIQDNGRGFDLQHSRRGNGLDNMASRALAIQATLRVHTAPGAGTRIEMNVPVT